MVLPIREHSYVREIRHFHWMFRTFLRFWYFSFWLAFMISMNFILVWDGLILVSLLTNLRDCKLLKIEPSLRTICCYFCWLKSSCIVATMINGIWYQLFILCYLRALTIDYNSTSSLAATSTSCSFKSSWFLLLRVCWRLFIGRFLNFIVEFRLISVLRSQHMLTLAQVTQFASLSDLWRG